MEASDGLERFLQAQKGVWEVAKEELRAGEKVGHWMWFIFPQACGLGRSRKARLYAIRGIEEAQAYLSHPILGTRLREAIKLVLSNQGKRSAEVILGEVDALKFRSCVTLFEAVAQEQIFAETLEAFYAGERCPLTQSIVSEWRDLQ